MIHFLPAPGAIAVAPPVDAVARVAVLANALAAAETFGGTRRTASDHSAIANAWPAASDGQHALFDALSAHAVAGSVAGLDALATLRDSGLQANREAIDTLTASIRGELERLDRLFTL